MLPAIVASEDFTGVFTLIEIEKSTAECVPYDIRAVPTIVVINNHNREIGRKIGFMSTGDVLAWLIDLGAI